MVIAHGTACFVLPSSDFLTFFWWWETLLPFVVVSKFLFMRGGVCLLFLPWAPNCFSMSFALALLLAKLERVASFCWFELVRVWSCMPVLPSRDSGVLYPLYLVGAGTHAHLLATWIRLPVVL